MQTELLPGRSLLRLPGTIEPQKPKELIPFPFQAEMLKELYRHIKANEKRILMIAPTGAGKTALASWVLKDATIKARKPIRCVFLVDLNCLIDQTVAELEGLGVPCVVLQGARSRSKKAQKAIANSRVIVASVQTITARMEKQSLREILGDVGLFFEDECHSTSQSKLADAIREVYTTGTIVVGLTATPWLPGSKKWLGQKYDVKVIAPPVSELIRMGRVVPAQTFSVDGVLDVEHLDTDPKTGDFSDFQMASQVGKKANLDLIVSEWIRLGEGRSTVAYCPKVESARLLAEAFNAVDIPAEWQSGNTPLGVDGRAEHEAGILTRAAQNYRLDVGITKIVCSVGTQVKGWNLKSLGCVMVIRATNVASLFCLDMETEILTFDGWKRCNEVSANEIVAGFDRLNGSIRWVSALGKIVRPVNESEKMIEYANHFANFRVSDQHNLLWRRRDRNEPGSEWHLSPAIDLAGRKSEFYLPVSGLQDAPGANLTDAEIRFLGLWITDGTLCSGGRAIFIIQSEHHTKQNEYIRQVLADCEFNYTVRRNSGHTQYNETSPRLWYYIKRGRGVDGKRDPNGVSRLDPYLDKNLSPLLEKLDDRQLAIFLEAVNIGDGHKFMTTRQADGRCVDGKGNLYTPQTYAITSGNRVFVDRLQSLCVRRGFRCNVSTRKSGYFELKISIGNSRMIGGSGASDRASLQVSDPSPEEMVWCVETETGTLVTRRNGKSVIMGNCQMVGRGSRTCDRAYWAIDEWGNPGGKKQNYILLDCGGNLSRFAKDGLSPNTLGEVPDRDYDISQPRQRKQNEDDNVKYCPECDQGKERPLRLFVRLCPNCDHEFGNKDDDQISLDLDFELKEWFDQRGAFQAGWIRSKRRACFNQNLSPDTAAEEFHKKFGFIPPQSWQVRSILNDRVLGHPVTDDDVAEFIDYLLQHQPEQTNRAKIWFSHHWFLEFGEAYDPKKYKKRRKKQTKDTTAGWWTIFGLTRRCSMSELKSAYRRLSREFHPDLIGESGEAKMKEINAAYDAGKAFLNGFATK
jgi:superfamily II DNA or RNA helicase